MACGTWGGTKTWKPDPIPPVNVTGYFQPSIVAGYQATVEVRSIGRNQTSRPDRPLRTASLTIPTGGLNTWLAPELREFAARLIQAAEQLEEADAWFSS